MTLCNCYIIPQNIEKIAALFPNCVTEREHNGKLEQAIDFDLLKQELSRSRCIVEGSQERYQLNWVGKADATVLANTPINKTLRPCREESVNFDNTENLFIEGDNLDALKLLQETYLGKVKMIYIDPPYNTGKDFIYKDKFSMENKEYQRKSGQMDDEGNHLLTEKENKGGFHSNWLSMIYSRLKLARNLLTDDGVIFISIDDNEQANLKRICDEVFGEGNFVADFIRKTKSTTNDAKTGVNYQHEFLLCYAKNLEKIDRLSGGIKDTSKYTNPDNDPNGRWVSDNPSAKSGNFQNGYFPVINPHTGKEDFPPEGRFWLFSRNTMQKHIDDGRICFKKEHKPDERGFIYKRYLKDLKTLDSTLDSLGFADNKYMNQVATKELKEMELVEYFSYPKGIQFIYDILNSCTNDNDLILDFFSGSATTAHAVMKLNAEDGGNRKFIMVQIPEKTDEKSEAHKAGYKTIAEISKERIRRAGQKIVQELEKNQKDTALLDVGFRVLKIDSSNMADIYYTPQQLQQGDMFSQVEHIKADRSEEDLLFQVLLDWGVDLTLPIDKQVINGKNVFFVDQSVLVACFDKEIDEELIKAITQYQPLRAVFRDDGFINDTTKINAEQLFKQLAPHSELRVI
ncbi:type III restriction-modification system methyltransferase (adenine-specific)/adenine specific DNA methylase Mod [Canicola haemoglobinophilus]|uniref:site-specific DNA-methyltransferase (adenine-specific) n=1 Tax=Canicola haemoglobinophilus TaxID=733 RepID=A0AB38H902_9PAST|nr:site-specific DNA-methyltransferase [Canicola haemoglobinophilus]STO54234.1 type III restriction-modification system methyltransferase (adenine-specific)/adenine specific DNA methylase Mod [Canicola haemoglobinophilus]STO68767.1 type III restriction-modification system methyltransferase (adenine-specific)/adenine specific DNA methylase Mod [Canicola haemoglobinophilus]